MEFVGVGGENPAIASERHFGDFTDAEFVGDPLGGFLGCEVSRIQRPGYDPIRSSRFPQNRCEGWIGDNRGSRSRHSGNNWTYNWRSGNNLARKHGGRRRLGGARGGILR